MSQYSISIIIPAYNVEDYISEALESIKKQTQAPDELIIIDDGSIDSTLSIIKSFQFNFPTKIVSIENRGQGNARNLGVSLASSEYIYYFDSDDLLVDTFIFSMKELISNKDYPDIILFSGSSFDDSAYNGNRWMDYSRNFEGVFSYREDLLCKGYLNNSLFCSPCLYISKKALWGERALKFYGNYYEDEAVFLPLIFSCKSFVVVDKVYFYRRNRNGSTMTIRPNRKHVKGTLDCIQSAVNLIQTPYYSSTEKFYVKKRLESYCIRHISICREAGYRISAKDLFKALIISKSSVLTLKVLLYSSGINNSALLKRVARVIKQ